MRTWRDTRGWLWPSTCAISPTESSIARSSIRIRNRVGSASAAKMRGSAAIYADIKMSLYPSSHALPTDMVENDWTRRYASNKSAASPEAGGRAFCPSADGEE
jgi:hypothetical protein